MQEVVEKRTFIFAKIQALSPVLKNSVKIWFFFSWLFFRTETTRSVYLEEVNFERFLFRVALTRGKKKRPSGRARLFFHSRKAKCEAPSNPSSIPNSITFIFFPSIIISHLHHSIQEKNKKIPKKNQKNRKNPKTKKQKKNIQKQKTTRKILFIFLHPNYCDVCRHAKPRRSVFSTLSHALRPFEFLLTLDQTKISLPRGCTATLVI